MWTDWEFSLLCHDCCVLKLDSIFVIIKIKVLNGTMKLNLISYVVTINAFKNFKYGGFMKIQNNQFVIGIIIIVVGLLILLNNLDIFNLSEQLFWGVVIAGLGINFLRLHKQKPEHRGLIWMGLIFIVIGTITILDSFIYFTDEIFGTMFLWFISAIFISVYIKNNLNWWALIPGGIFLILGAIVIIESYRLLPDDLLGFVFLFGFSLIFWFLYLIKDEKNKLEWAKYPAAIFAIISFFVLSFVWNSSLSNFIFPISIILLGLYFLLKGFQSKKGDLEESSQEEKPDNIE